VITDILLLVLSLGVAYLSIKTIARLMKEKKSKEYGTTLRG